MSAFTHQARPMVRGKAAVAETRTWSAEGPDAKFRTLPYEAVNRTQPQYVSLRGGMCPARDLDTGGQDA